MPPFFLGSGINVLFVEGFTLPSPTKTIPYFRSENGWQENPFDNSFRMEYVVIMIAFVEMLAGPAQEAGIKVPENVQTYLFDEYPHFHVYETVQLGSPLPYPTAHWNNAKVIAAIPEDKIRLVTMEQLRELGVDVGFPYP